MLRNSVAIVTGAASGIGRATAACLASHGCVVAGVDLSRIDDEELDLTVELDLTAPGAAAELLTQVQRDLEAPPTILVNCAGITRDGWIWKMPESDWDRVVDVNLKVPFLLTQAFAKATLESASSGDCAPPSSSRAIVNISSIIGKVGNLGQANYAASKAGLIGLTKASAKDLARAGIRVNAILPGFIHTPMAAAVPEKVQQSFKAQIPLGDFGEADDIAEAAAFLASSRSKYITGAVLEVTGGLYM